MSNPDKDSVRQAMRERLSGFSPSDQATASDAICRFLEQTPAFMQARNVAAFAALPGEPDLGRFLEGKQRDADAGPRMHLPRVNGQQLVFCVVTPALRRGRFGIPEPLPTVPESDPDILDLILVPGLAFTPAGARLGRGRGFYDRWLGSLARDVPRIGVTFDCQIVPELPLEAHDATMHAVLTERGWRKPLDAVMTRGLAFEESDLRGPYRCP